MKIFRCKWCIKRVGSPTWFSADGLAVAVSPKMIDEREISDSICPACKEIAIAELAGQRAELEKETEKMEVAS